MSRAILELGLAAAEKSRGGMAARLPFHKGDVNGIVQLVLVTYCED